MCLTPCAQASAQVPNDDLLVTSDCQRHMSATRPDLMRLLANANETDTGVTLRRLGELRLRNTSTAYRVNWRVGMHAGFIPRPFRRQGMLWWFQVLTNFWIRARGSLKQRLMEHVALDSLRTQLQNRPRAIPPAAIAEPIGRGRCGRRPCDRLGAGWFPDVWFDVGLHIRRGDACGAKAPQRGQRARRCSDHPLQDAFALMNAHQLRGHVFLATDSGAIARASEAVGALYGFQVSTLPIDRKQHESLCLSSTTRSRGEGLRCGTEFVDRTRERDLNMLTDTLLDSLLVSLAAATACLSHAILSHACRPYAHARAPNRNNVRGSRSAAVTLYGARRGDDVKLPPSRFTAAHPNADQ